VKEVRVPTQTTEELQRKTIADFGEQWVRYSDNAGFYGSLELFQDAFGPLVSPKDIEGSVLPTSEAAPAGSCLLIGREPLSDGGRASSRSPCWSRTRARWGSGIASAPPETQSPRELRPRRLVRRTHHIPTRNRWRRRGAPAPAAVSPVAYG
jgi:hypothetical protein